MKNNIIAIRKGGTTYNVYSVHSCYISRSYWDNSVSYVDIEFTDGSGKYRHFKSFQDGYGDHGTVIFECGETAKF